MTLDLLARVERVLERERLWSAYALADLEPPLAADAQWLAGEEAVVLVFRAFEPPVLFAAGSPDEARRLLAKIPSGRYLFTLMGTHRALLAPRIQESTETQMWRMALHPEAFDAGLAAGAEPLSRGDLPAIEALLGEHPDRPDAFDPGQLDDLAFFGVRQGGALVAVAGTHVVSLRRRLAAVGNVFTHPQHRSRGLATRVTAGVVHTLLGRGVETIVLNVSMRNAPAIGCYERLGFWPFCGYYEGVGHVGPASDSIQE